MVYARVQIKEINMYVLTQLMNITILVTLSVLIYIAIRDIREKTIPVSFVVIVTVFGLINQGMSSCSTGAFGFEVLGLIIGTCLLLLVSKLTKEQLGYGDGLVFMMMSALASWELAATAFVLAFLFSGVVGLVLIAVNRKRRGQTMPFVPFITVAYMLLVFVR